MTADEARRLYASEKARRTERDAERIERVRAIIRGAEERDAERRAGGRPARSTRSTPRAHRVQPPTPSTTYTRCGHPRTPENTYTHSRNKLASRKPNEECRTCAMDRNHRRNAARRKPATERFCTPFERVERADPGVLLGVMHNDAA